jgi:sugar/nucleoside kinase (ribokinase family)
MAKIIYNRKETPYTYVLSDPSYDSGHGERCFINNIGAAWDITAEDLDDQFFSSDILMFGGTALVPGISDRLPGLLKKGKEKGCITVVTTVYDFLNEKKNPAGAWQLGGSPETYRYTDLLIMDQEEALRISGLRDVDRLPDFYIDSGVSAFVITNGARSVLLYSDGRLFRETGAVVSMPVSEMIIGSLKDPSVTKGDTTGCGDNFAGGVIAAMARQLQQEKTRDLSLLQACSWGIVSGGFACFYMGGTYLEKEDLEKYKLILPYHKAYRKQLSRDT